MANRSLLCECSVQSGLSFLPQDIGSCANKSIMPTFHYTTNLAFLQVYPTMLQLAHNIAQMPSPEEFPPKCFWKHKFPFGFKRHRYPTQTHRPEEMGEKSKDGVQKRKLKILQLTLC